MSEIGWPELQDRELNHKPDTEERTVFKWQLRISQLQADCKAEIKLKWPASVSKAQRVSVLR